MTLTRLLLAWLLVAAWFVVATMGVARAGAHPPATRGLLTWRVIEAGVVTLFASLWFDSLGYGEWWLLFALVGVLAAVPARLGDGAWLAALADVLRYVVAGGILAWRLG